MIEMYLKGDRDTPSITIKPNDKGFFYIPPGRYLVPTSIAIPKRAMPAPEAHYLTRYLSIKQSGIYDGVA